MVEMLDRETISFPPFFFRREFFKGIMYTWGDKERC